MSAVGEIADARTLVRSPAVWLGVVVLALAAYLYYPVFFPPDSQTLSLESEEFFFEANEAAGGPVLVLALWLFYRRSHYRDLLAGRAALAPSLAVFGLTLGVFCWGVYTGSNDIQLASAIGLLVACALLLGGRAALRAYWLPILFLGFALPVAPVPLAAAMFPIQLFNAEFAGLILNALGVASYVQGDQILRPENTFIVIETCSGVRTVFTLLMLTVLLIDLFERRGRHAVILFALVPLVAFATNGVRIVTLVLNPHSSIHSIHNLQGIAMLLVGLTAMYLIDGLLERFLAEGEAVAETVDYGLKADTAASGISLTSRLAMIGAALVLMCGLQLGLPRWPDARQLSESPADLLARVYGEHATRELPIHYDFMGSVWYRAFADREIEIDGRPVRIHLGIGDERERSRTVLSGRLAWPDSGYSEVESANVELTPGGPQVRRTVLRRGARSVLTYAWYERSRGWLGEWLRHALALDRSFLARDAYVVALRFSTPLGASGAGVAEAEARLREAWGRLEPELSGYGHYAD